MATTPRAYRSMNSELLHGALDGTVRFLRPNAAGADETAARSRAEALHPLHYGFMGLESGSDERIRSLAFDAGLR